MRSVIRSLDRRIYRLITLVKGFEDGLNNFLFELGFPLLTGRKPDMGLRLVLGKQVMLGLAIWRYRFL
jgi:hypothetical protein